MESTFDAFSDPKFFPDPLENQDVRIDSHPDRENDPRDTGQGKRCTETGKGTEDNQNIDRQCDTGDDAGDQIINRHKDDDQGSSDDHRHFCRSDRIACKRRPYLVHLDDFQRHIERVIQNVRQFKSIPLRETPTDLRRTAGDSILNGRCGIKHAVENDREATGNLSGTVFFGDTLSQPREIAAAFSSKIDQDTESAIFIAKDPRSGNRFPGHFRKTRNEDRYFLNFSGSILFFEMQNFISERDFVFGKSDRIDGPMNKAKFEKCRTLQFARNVGVVSGGDSRQLHFDAAFPNGPDNRLGDSESVGPGADNLDRFVEHQIPLMSGEILTFFFGKSEREGNTAAKIESELKTRLSILKKLVQNQIVALLGISKTLFEPHIRIKLMKIDPLLVDDRAERHELGDLWILRGDCLGAIHKRV